MSVHLYIHIPFCHRRCSYCDFNTYAHLEDRIAAYVDALCAELRMLAAAPPPPAPSSPEAAKLHPTIFFGGGTPTMLSLAQFEQILMAADALVPLNQAEITSEANPGTVLSPAYLRGLRSLGVNRLSMGVQSLHDPTLRLLGRIHTAAEARQSYEQAREAGFTRINLDFIFGLPGQDQAQWEATLATISTWQVDHFSLYSLILEETTPLFAQVTTGRIIVPDDDATAAMYEAAISQLGAAGYTHYEISNWARDVAASVFNHAAHPASPSLVLPDPGATPQPGLQVETDHSTLNWLPAQACHHNLAYWLNSDYLAAGAGAHGHGYPERYANLRGVDDYIRAVASGQRPIAERTPLTPHDLCAETMLMGLRLNQGVSLAHFAARTGQRLVAVYGPVLADLVAQGLLEQTSSHVRLTNHGRMLGNRVFERFL